MKDLELLEAFRARYPGHDIQLMDREFYAATGILLVTGYESYEEPVYRCPECGQEVEGALYEEAGRWEGWVGMRPVWGFACRACGWMGYRGDLPKERRWGYRTWSREEVLEAVRRPLRPLPMHSGEERQSRARWALAVIERHLEAVASAPQGARNQTLARAAATIGAIIAKVGEEVITAAEAEARLLDAAMACGLKPDEARSTIQRQMRWGLSRG